MATSAPVTSQLIPRLAVPCAASSAARVAAPLKAASLSCRAPSFRARFVTRVAASAGDDVGYETDGQQRLLSGEWPSSVSVYAYEDLAARATVVEPTPASGYETDGQQRLVSGEWPSDVSIYAYEDLATKAALAKQVSLGYESDGTAKGYETDGQQRLVSGEWPSNVATQAYEDVRMYWAEEAAAGRPSPQGPYSAILPSQGHGALSGEWPSSVATQSYEDVQKLCRGK